MIYVLLLDNVLHGRNQPENSREFSVAVIDDEKVDVDCRVGEANQLGV